MRRLHLLAVALAISGAGVAPVVERSQQQTVEIPSGRLQLKGALWRPAGRGPFPAVVFHHGRSDAPRQYSLQLGLTLEQLAEIVGPVFVRRGYVFLYPFRRGEGPSADQGPFIGDLLQKAEAAKGLEARQHLQLVLLTTDHLEDALAALSFLKSLPVRGHTSRGRGRTFFWRSIGLARSLARPLRARCGGIWGRGRFMGWVARAPRSVDRNREPTHDASHADSARERLLAFTERCDGEGTVAAIKTPRAKDLSGIRGHAASRAQFPLL